MVWTPRRPRVMGVYICGTVFGTIFRSHGDLCGSVGNFHPCISHGFRSGKRKHDDRFCGALSAMFLTWPIRSKLWGGKQHAHRLRWRLHVPVDGLADDGMAVQEILPLKIWDSAEPNCSREA